MAGSDPAALLHPPPERALQEWIVSPRALVTPNLAIWFGIHAIFRKTVAVDGYGLSFDMPVLTSMDLWSFLLSVAAAIAIFRLRAGVLQTLAGSCLAGIGLFLVGAI